AKGGPSDLASRGRPVITPGETGARGYARLAGLPACLAGWAAPCDRVLDGRMATWREAPRVVSASREIAAGAGRDLALDAHPGQQPRWDGNDNLAMAPGGQRVRRAGAVVPL